MRQFFIVAWIDNAPHARVGGRFVPLDDPALPYEQVRADYQALAPSGVHEQFDAVELFALANSIKAKKLITPREADRRRAAPEAAQKSLATVAGAAAEPTVEREPTVEPEPTIEPEPEPTIEPEPKKRRPR